MVRAVPVSVVLPTFDRAAALGDCLDGLLALGGVHEVVVVDDGSRDATRAVLAAAAARDPRLRPVHHERNRGVAAARNSGTDVARGAWVLFAEDDCRFPRDYAQVLREEAEAHDAHVVGAPMVWPGPEGVAAAVAEARARGGGDGGLDDLPGFPPAALETPLLPAPALVARSVLDAVRFDEGFRGNAYREETDFFLRAARAGFRCLLTPRTFFWEAGRWPGGQARGRLAAEWWTLYGNWRLLRRHGDWLAERGLIASPAREQLAFAARRAARLVRGG